MKGSDAGAEAGTGVKSTAADSLVVTITKKDLDEVQLGF